MQIDEHAIPSPETHVADPRAVAALHRLIGATPRELRVLAGQLAHTHASAIADEFYTALMEDAGARLFLSNEIVSKRLRASMEDWLRRLFLDPDYESPESIIARQIQVGAIHARIKLPPQLMQEGVRLLSIGLRRRVAEAGLKSADLVALQLFVTDLFYLADGLMITAYVHELQKGTRADEAYRQVLMGHDAPLERERQRAALSDWTNELLFAVGSGGALGRVPRLAESEFGLWMVHKGRVLFEGTPDARVAQDVVDMIDAVLLPKFALAGTDKAALQDAFEELKRQIDFLRYLFSDLFDRLNSVDKGRDTITGLHSRRHLGAVITRQLDEHRRLDRPFGVLLVKIDSLDPTARSEEAKQVLLQQFAALLLESARAVDHVFRYGTQEFLILAAEASHDSLRIMAEDLRKRVWTHRFMVRMEPQAKLTASVGMAVFDGHPDYMRLLRRAEQATVKAVVAGGNQVVEA